MTSSVLPQLAPQVDLQLKLNGPHVTRQLMEPHVSSQLRLHVGSHSCRATPSERTSCGTKKVSGEMRRNLSLVGSSRPSRPASARSGSNTSAWKNSLSSRALS